MCEQVMRQAIASVLMRNSPSRALETIRCVACPLCFALRVPMAGMAYSYAIVGLFRFHFYYHFVRKRHAVRTICAVVNGKCTFREEWSTIHPPVFGVEAVP